MSLEIIAFIAGLIGSTATLPQLYQVLKTKQIEGISTYMFMMKNSAYGLWMVFGFVSGTNAIIFWNFFALTLSTSVIIAKLRIISKAEKVENVVQMDFSNDEIREEMERPKLRLVYSAKA